MAALLNERVGGTVGYAIRGERRVSSKRSGCCRTQITVVTDGILLQRLRHDPELSGIDMVIFDEFHERGVGSDVALALTRESQRLWLQQQQQQQEEKTTTTPTTTTTDLRIVVMSATLLGSDGESDDGSSTASKLVKALGGSEECRVLQSEGRQFPIDVVWKPIEAPPLSVLSKDRKALVRLMTEAIEQGVSRAPNGGDVLAFLPGAAEIRRTVTLLQERNNKNNLKQQQQTIEILPLYGALSKEQQDRALLPSAARDGDGGNKKSRRQRVIVSSPIAEASLTLEGVTCVVDSGLRREPRCDIDTGMPRLVTAVCSRASCQQRAGRAGRVQEGLCLRLFGESEFEDRFPEHAPPEIASADLSDTVLLLLDWGCANLSEIVDDLAFVDPPSRASLRQAIRLLRDLGALEQQGKENDGDRLVLTSLGRDVAKIPAHPRFATALVQAASTDHKDHHDQYNPVQLAAAAAAVFLLDDDELRLRTAKGEGPALDSRVRKLYQGKLGTRAVQSLRKYAARIGDTAHQAVKDALDEKIPPVDVSKMVGQALLPGFIDLVAQRKGEASYGGSTYMLSLGRSARLDDIPIQDAPEYIVVVETSTGDDGKARIRSFAPIDKDTLLDAAAEQDVLFTVPSRGYEVRARRVVSVGTLELSSMPLPSPSADQVTSILKDTIQYLGGIHAALVQTLAPEKRRRVDELCSRVRLATKLSKNEGDNNGNSWPDCFAALDAQASRAATEKDDAVLQNLVDPWLSGCGSLKKVDILDVLHGALSPEQQCRLDSEYPVKIEAPDGTKIPVSYLSEQPSASAKLQQFFGTVETPSVGPPSNRVPLSLDLLSPSGKILAQTMDLPFFWREAYSSVRAEMRGRYSKHPWPEDPMTAVATRYTKKKQADFETAAAREKGASTRSKKKQRRKRR